MLVIYIFHGPKSNAWSTNLTILFALRTSYGNMALHSVIYQTPPYSPQNLVYSHQKHPRYTEEKIEQWVIHLYFGIFLQNSLQKVAGFTGSTKCNWWLTVKCWYPCCRRVFYAAQMSDTPVVPGRIYCWITGSIPEVWASLWSTATRNPCRVSGWYPSKTYKRIDKNGSNFFARNV